MSGHRFLYVAQQQIATDDARRLAWYRAQVQDIARYEYSDDTTRRQNTSACPLEIALKRQYDYNNNGVVDADDDIVRRKTNGMHDAPPSDNGPWHTEWSIAFSSAAVGRSFHAGSATLLGDYGGTVNSWSTALQPACTSRERREYCPTPAPEKAWKVTKKRVFFTLSNGEDRIRTCGRI